MTKGYKVLHVITTFPISSGAAENTKLTLNLLDRGRFQPFLATRLGQSMDAAVAEDVERVGVHWLRREIAPLADLRALAELSQVIGRIRPHIVHTHNAKDGILGRWAARLTHVPAIVHTIHNVSFQASSSRLANRLFLSQERWAAKFTDRLLAVSRENSAKYIRAGIGHQDQYRTVYSGLELDRYADDGRPGSIRRANLGLPERPGPWVAWIGRFNHQKDPITFVQAARIVATRVPGVQFVICGNDPLGDSLEDRVHTAIVGSGLEDAVHFLGFRKDIPNVLRAVDVLMHSSRYEGMGRIVCEALACERPVAGTAVDGVVEVIESGRRGGLLVSPGDPIGLAGAAARLLEDQPYARMLARAGHQWVVAHLSARTMVSDIESVYCELLSRRQWKSG